LVFAQNELTRGRSKVGRLWYFYLPGASGAGAPGRALRFRPEPPHS
jgi:hypothetical protein